MPNQSASTPGIMRQASAWGVLGIIAAIAALSMQASSITGSLLDEKPTYPILGSCSGYEQELFDEASDHSSCSEEEGVLNITRCLYHARTNDIVEAYKEENLPEPICDAQSADGLYAPPPALVNTAKLLAPWKERKDRDLLRRQHFGAVLLEHLRAYECALVERQIFLPVDIWGEKQLADGANFVFGWYDLIQNMVGERSIISRELRNARNALHRTLALLGGRERTHLLRGELICIQQASLDARNAMALAAESAACLPRAWDANDHFHDLPEDEEE